MAQSKREQQAIRNILLRDGSVRSSFTPSQLKASNKAASQANAIAARREELRQGAKK